MNPQPMPAELPRLQQLNALKLPTLPAGMPFLFESLTDESIDFVELAAVLENFPSIAGRLISLANSVWSAPAAVVSSLDGACARLGFGVVRSTSIALAVAAPFDAARCPAFDPERYWCGALLAADAASRLSLAATCADAAEPATARCAALLHDLGLLWLVDRLPEAMDQALASTATEPATSLRQALADILGFDQVKASARLADAWTLPEPLAIAMTHYREVDYRGPHEAVVMTVGVAVSLAASTLDGYACPAPDERISRLGIARKHFDDVYRQLDEQAAKTREIAKLLV